MPSTAPGGTTVDQKTALGCFRSMQIILRLGATFAFPNERRRCKPSSSAPYAAQKKPRNQLNENSIAGVSFVDSCPHFEYIAGNWVAWSSRKKEGSLKKTARTLNLFSE